MIMKKTNIRIFMIMMVGSEYPNGNCNGGNIITITQRCRIIIGLLKDIHKGFISILRNMLQLLIYYDFFVYSNQKV